MQSSSQYGVPEVPAQFVVGRVPSSGAHSHIFSLAHDMTLSPKNSSPHPHPQPQSLHSSEQQQQQQHGSNQQMIAHKIRLESDSPEVAAPLPAHPKVNNSGNTTTNNYSSSNQNNTNNITTDNYNKQQQQQQEVVQLGGDEDVLGSEDFERGSAGNRWPRQETLALLKIRSEMDANFRDAGLKGPLWEDVSRRLAELGYYRNAKKCKEKFENVHKYYKRTKEGRAGRQDGKSYRFFNQLEALYGSSNPGNLNNMNSSNKKVTVAISGASPAPVGILPIAAAPHVNQESKEIDNSIAVKAAAKPVNQTLDFSTAAAMSFSSSDTSEDEYDEPDDHDHDHNRKRKRPSSSSSSESMAVFFENLMKQVIEKQEAMQRKFMEAIEKREQERMIREEAWKRQEMARLSREQELKSQERSISASRDAALVAFLQKVTGQTLQLQLIPPQFPSAPQLQLLEPPPPPPPPPPPSANQTDNVNNPNAVQDHQVVIHHEDIKDLSSFDPNSKRWPKPEVLTLIKLRSGMEQKFHEPGPKSPLWEEISAAMANLGYNRSAKRCKEKWENINKYFRKAKESNKKRPENAKTCPYFHQLDALYKKRNLANRQTKIMEKDSTVNGNDQKVEDQEELIEHEQPSGSNRDQQGDHGVDTLAVMPSAHGEPHAYNHERTNPNSNSTARDANSGFMAMVHKLTTDHPPEFNMSTSSNTE